MHARRTGIPALCFGMVMLIPLFYLPVGAVLLQAFRTPEGTWSAGELFSRLSSAYTWRIARFTVTQAFFSTLGSVLIGLPGAYLISHREFRGKNLLRSVSTIPFVLPPILVVLGFVIFYGNQGFLNRALMNLFSLQRPPLRIMYSFFAIVLAHSFYNFPIILRSVGTRWESLSNHYEQAAYSLGAKPLRVFFTVTLPRLMPALISSSSLVFLFCFTSFAVILVLGGGPRFTTLEVEIYRQARTSLDMSSASVFALISLVFTFTLLLFYNRLSRTSVSREPGGRSTSVFRPCSSPLSRAAVFLYICFALLFLLAPLVSVMLRSFQAQTHRAGDVVWTLQWYTQLFSRTGGSLMGAAASAVLQSLTIALVTSAAAAPLALLFSYGTARMSYRGSSVMEVILMLPMMVSSIILGLGYVLTARTVRANPHMLIVLAHMVITLPFIYRITVPAAREAYRSYAPAAYSLGAKPLRTFLDIELPLIKKSLLTGAVFVFALSMGEFNAALILSDASIQTIPILMYRLIGAYNFFGACALGTILMICCAAAFYLFDRSSSGGLA